MVQASDSGFKTLFLPKIRVEPDRVKDYRRKYSAWIKAGNKGSFAEWIRVTLDGS